MFGSQALETVIGLVLMFFVIALGASSIVEIGSRLVSKRAKDLEKTIGAMLAGTGASDPDIAAALNAFRGTTIYDSAKAAAGKTLFRRNWKLPSYLSAKAFADAVDELSDVRAATENLPASLRTRIDTLVREVGADATKIKAGLESWFDETMERLSGAYKRWSTMLLFVVGLMIAILANASTFHVADRLWHDPVTRQAVADSATKVAGDGAGATELESIAATTDKLTELQLPVGWTTPDRAEWHRSSWWRVWNWSWNQLAHVAGWLATALLVMLGAPFWFDVLTKAVALRGSGAKPEQATADKTSATAKVAAANGPPTLTISPT